MSACFSAATSSSWVPKVREFNMYIPVYWFSYQSEFFETLVSCKSDYRTLLEYIGEEVQSSIYLNLYSGIKSGIVYCFCRTVLEVRAKIDEIGELSLYMWRNWRWIHLLLLQLIRTQWKYSTKKQPLPEEEQVCSKRLIMLLLLSSFTASKYSKWSEILAPFS